MSYQKDGDVKGRLEHFMSGSINSDRSIPNQKALQAYPTLTRLAQGISQRKLSEWTISDEYYHERFKEIRLCLHGLIGHGACLAAQGEMEHLPVLRDFICGLASFWPDPYEETDNPAAREEQYGTLFDKAVSKAQNGGDITPLSKEQKKNILIGLENYIIDAASQGEMDYALTKCEAIAVQLKQSWQKEGLLQTQQLDQTPG